MSKWCNECARNKLNDEWQSCDNTCPVFGCDLEKLAEKYLRLVQELENQLLEGEKQKMNKTTEIVFEKTLHFPTACVGVGKGQGFKTVEVDIRLAKKICKDWKTLEERQMYVFTASASVKGLYGQCLDFIQENAEKYMIPEERRVLYNRIYEIWSEYHLNDLQAGTEKQTALLTKEQCRIDNYEKACETLEHFGLFEDRGYKYGHGLLCKEIPVEVVAEIMTWKDVEDLSKLEISKIRRKAQCKRAAR